MKITHLLLFIFSSPFLSSLPLSEIENFSTVYETIKSIYVDEISEETLMLYAIEGMIGKLDPHSDYLQKSDIQTFNQTTNGVFGGLGIELCIKNDLIEIMSVSPNSPAETSGLKSHDLILMIEDTLTQGMSLKEAMTLLRGEPGSSVKLSVISPDQKSHPKQISIQRELIKNPSVSSKILDQKWGYIRIFMFNEETTHDFFEALEAQLASGIAGMILDLRQNPGGLLRSSAQIANAFLNEKNALFNKRIVSAKGQSDHLFLEETISGPDLTHGIPVVVLVNQGSASASEIVAGALQDHHRAIIIGEQTFGKGSVQIIVPIGENALKITCSRYYTPADRSIQSIGISPDIIVREDYYRSSETPDPKSLRISEANLNRHLHNNVAAKTEIADLQLADPFIQEGIHILTALSLQENFRRSEDN